MRSMRCWDVFVIPLVGGGSPMLVVVLAVYFEFG